jgi:predicted O-linked N-acetylglucosamine transferase (SPINDLY family)
VRGSFDEATKLVEQASALTLAQKDQVEGRLASIREARLEREYRDALVLEHDFRYEEAVQKYTELLENAQYYKDVIARKDTLEEYMKLAADLYGKAEAATAPEEKHGNLQQIREIWPEYNDNHVQIKSREKTQTP